MAFNEIDNTRSVELAEAIMRRLSQVLSPQIRQPGPWGEPQATTIIRDAQNDINFARQQEDRERENRLRISPRSPSPISDSETVSDEQSSLTSNNTSLASTVDNEDTITVTCEDCGFHTLVDRHQGDADIRSDLYDQDWELDDDLYPRDQFANGWYCGDCGLPDDTRTWACIWCGEEIQGPTDDYPDGWTMDEDGNEICGDCQNNYNTCDICGRMAERDGDNLPEGWQEDESGYYNCESCAINIRVGQEREDQEREGQEREGGGSHKKRTTRRKTQKKKKKQSRKSKKR